MYSEHFGLRQPPFRNTPDTRLFYAGSGRGDVLDALVYAITSGEGIVKVVGEVGTGKTMLCRMLEERLPANVEIVYLANPSLTPEEIVHAIALELGLSPPPGANRLQVMHELHETLLERHGSNRRVVALVEEAQSMPVDTLEEIRLLSNLETKHEKLLQIVLFGQPELDRNLSDPAIRQLRERITHSFHLKPLGPEAVAGYVEFRLRASGYRGRDPFTPAALRALSKASRGLTRRVNIIADKALLAAYADDTHDVSARHVKVAIEDSEFNVRPQRRLGMAALFAGAMLFAGALGWLAASWLAVPGPTRVAAVAAVGAGDAAAPPPPAPAAEDAPRSGGSGAGAAAPEAPVEAVARPVAAPGAVAEAPATSGFAAEPSSDDAPAPALGPRLSADTSRIEVETATEPEPPPVGVATPTAVAQAARLQPSPREGAGGEVEPVIEAAEQRPRGERADGVPATMPETDEPGVAAAAAPPPAAVAAAGSVEDAPAAVSPQSRPAPPPASAAGAVPPAVAAAPEPALAAPTAPADLLHRRLRATRSWLEGVSGNRYSIQLLATRASYRSNLLDFLRRLEREGRLERVFVYETRINERAWYAVLYGDFTGFSQARRELEELPEELLRHKPFVRNVKTIAVGG